MSGHYLSEPTAKLRDYASPARVERVWRRLQTDLPSSAKRVEPAGRRSPMWWMPAAAAAIFGLGFFLGSQHGETPATALKPESIIEAEPGLRPPPPSPVRMAEEPTLQKPKRRRHVTRQAPVAPKTSDLDAPEPEPAAVVVPTASVPTAPPEWQQLANLGEYAPAHQALEVQGGFDAVLETASAEQLMILVDIARATGKKGRAIQALRRVTEQFPSDPNAPIAAMMLGNMLMQAGDRAGAAAAFALNRRLSPEGDFAEDALAREFEAAISQGNIEQAKHLAEQYEKDFPNGRRLDDIRKELSEALAPGKAPESASEPAGGEPSEADGASEDAAPADEPATAGHSVPGPAHPAAPSE